MAEAYTDLLIHIRNRSEGEQRYPVEVTLSDGSFFSGQIELDQQELLAAGLDAQQYGQLLYEALLAGGPISRAYSLATGLARQENEGRLRVRLWLDERAPELQLIRWERLYHYFNDQLAPLSTTGQTPFSRYTALGIAEPKPIQDRPLKLLVAIANPKDLAEFGLAEVKVEEEVQNIRAALKGLVGNGLVAVTLLAGPDNLSPELSQELVAEGYVVETVRTSLDNVIRRLPDHHVFHFIGHGSYRRASQGADGGHASLYFEKRDGRTEPVRDDQFEEKFRGARRMPQLVFLVACESAKREAGEALMGLAPRLVQAGTPAVVAMQERIAMDTARDLTRYFYEQLLKYGVVDRALNEARNLLYNQKIDDWSIPALFMRLRTGQLFTADPVQTALEAMRQHNQFNFYDLSRGAYIPLPVEVVHLSGEHGFDNLERLQEQGAAVKEVLPALEEALASRRIDQQGRPQILALVGGFGANKSTQMRRLVWQTLEQAQGQPGRCCLPVYVDLENYKPAQASVVNPLEAEILRSLGFFWPDLKAKELADLPTRANLRILINGLESLADQDRQDALEQLLALATRHVNYQYVLSSRSTDLDWARLSEEAELHLLVIQLLRPTRVRHFLENFDKIVAGQGQPQRPVGQVGRPLLAEIYRSQLFDLVAIPRFMLELVQQAQRSHYPKSRTEALAWWVDEAIAQFAPGRGMRALAAETIYQVAWQMQTNRQRIWQVSEAFRVMDRIRGERGYDLEELYNSYLEHDLLVEMGEASLRFTYRPVQAYCCAKAILNRPDQERILTDITLLAGAPDQAHWWEDTLVLVCGLMAAENKLADLEWLLGGIIYGVNLLEGEQAFLAARCLLESQAHIQALEPLRQHVIAALRWRTDARNEPRPLYRMQSAEILSRLAEPVAIVDLAGLVYQKARQNLSEQADYEFSSVRFAAAIGLKRMPSRKKVDHQLSEVSKALIPVFHHWEDRQTAGLVQLFNETSDSGVQALVALALGDLVAQAELYQGQETEPALNCLIEAFKRPEAELALAVRWALADALAMLDPFVVSCRLVWLVREELQKEIKKDGQLSSLNKAKSLVYLIGLLRSRDPLDRAFLIDECIKGTADLKLWLTTIKALGALANRDDRQLLIDLAIGRLAEPPLAERFPDPADQARLRQEAMTVLAEIGDRETLAQLRQTPFDGDERLRWIYYQAASDIHRRTGKDYE